MTAVFSSEIVSCLHVSNFEIVLNKLQNGFQAKVNSQRQYVKWKKESYANVYKFFTPP